MQQQYTAFKILSAVVVFFLVNGIVNADSIDEANKILLSNPYMIYSNGSQVLNHPAPGFIAQDLITINLYKGSPGCYVACYSHQGSDSVYMVSDNTYVLGQVRIAGKYSNNKCEPINFSTKDIGADDGFKKLCTEQISACAQNKCWAGGDTGAWLGI